MNLLSLSLAYLRGRALNALLNIVLLALGIGTIIVLMLFGAQFENRLTRDARGLDLVIGAPGSPLQLVLSSIYHADIPTGNIPLEEAAYWRQSPLVDAIFPLALGDNVAGFRIVGTETPYVDHYGAKLASGTLWAEPHQATLGATVAAQTGLRLGDKFIGSHGLVAGGTTHGDHPLEVVGILTPNDSVIDRLVLTSIESVWLAHGIDPHGAEHDGHDAEQDGHGDAAEIDATHADARPLEVTALLVRFTTPIAAIQLPVQVNQKQHLLAASPALEMSRLLSLVGIGLDTLRGFGLLLVGTAGLSVFIALSNAMQERRYDLAVMRTLGASRRTLFAQPLVEGLMLAAAGALLGVVVGHGVTELLGRIVPEARELGLTGGLVLAQEAYVVGLALAIGLSASLIPAIQAYRADIAALLATRS